MSKGENIESAGLSINPQAPLKLNEYKGECIRLADGNFWRPVIGKREVMAEGLRICGYLNKKSRGLHLYQRKYVAVVGTKLFWWVYIACNVEFVYGLILARELTSRHTSEDSFKASSNSMNKGYVELMNYNLNRNANDGFSICLVYDFLRESERGEVQRK